MRRLRIGVLDLATKSQKPSLYGRLMHANLASIMPQAIAVWCEQAGHDVTLCCFTGVEDLLTVSPDDLDLVLIGAFTQSAQVAYALSTSIGAAGRLRCWAAPMPDATPKTRSSTSITCLASPTGARSRTCCTTPSRSGRWG